MMCSKLQGIQGLSQGNFFFDGEKGSLAADYSSSKNVKSIKWPSLLKIMSFL
jgi:hypothetical protein